MRCLRVRFLPWALACGSAACDAEPESSEAETDVRCQALCRIAEPEVDGAFDVCSEASAELCVQLCEQRIRQQDDLCATCLLEGAVFYPHGDNGLSGGAEVGGDDESSLGCPEYGRIDGPEGSCEYCEDDKAAYEECARTVHPRREIECTTHFRGVEECSASCD